MAITIRPARVTDATALSHLGAATFRETFDGTTSPENMRIYLSEAYSPEKQASEIVDPDNTVIVAETDEGELVGFAYVGIGEIIEGVSGPGVVELKRIYVANAWHGKGVAHSLMSAALDAGRARGAHTIWLGVWEHNARALGFYYKYGFKRVGEHPFVLGDDAQTDWVLALSL
jgi:ribosomal protein S18 acetylase RimI-like enzyme